MRDDYNKIHDEKKVVEKERGKSGGDRKFFALKLNENTHTNTS